MIIHSVNPTGMFSYGESDRIDIQGSGLVHLIGVNQDRSSDSNGSGKSALFYSICEILYGKNPTGVSGSAMVNKMWQRGMCGIVEFTSWEGFRYKVVYCRDWNDPGYVEYSGTAIYFGRKEDGTWKDLRGPDMHNTRLKIVRAIGMEYEEFLSVSYASSKVGNILLKGTNRDKIELISNMSRVMEWDNILVMCREEATKLKTDLSVIDNKIFDANKYVKEWNDRKIYLESMNPDHEIRTREEEIKSILNVVDNMQEECIELNHGINNEFVTELNEEYKTNEKEKFVLRSSRDAMVKSAISNAYNPKVEEMRSSISDLRSRVFHNKKSTDLLISSESCPTCGSKISDSKKSKLKKELEDEMKLLGEEESKLKERESEVSKSIEERKLKVEKELSEIDEKIRVIEDKNRVINENYNLCRDNNNDINTRVNKIVHEMELMNKDVERMQGEVEFYKTFFNEMSEVVSRLLECDSEREKLNSNRESINKDLVTYQWYVSNIPYIKLHKLYVFMSLLSDAVNKHLYSMGDTMRMTISPFGEKKSSKNVHDSMDRLKKEVTIEITDGVKSIDSRLYSDGESSKISHAVMRAMNDICDRMGIGCNLMFMDEVFSFVDEDNSQRMMGCLESVPEGKTVIVTDNSGKVGKMMRFDQTWKVVKSMGMSKLTQMEM